MYAWKPTLALIICLTAAAAAQNAGELRSCTEEGYLRIGVHPQNAMEPPGDLLLIDPNGRKLGNEPGHRDWNQFEQAWFSLEGLDDDETGEPGQASGVFEVCNPPSGNYTLKMFGATKGRYEIEIYASERERPDARGLPQADSSHALLAATDIARGAVHVYEIKFSNVPGSKVQATRK